MRSHVVAYIDVKAKFWTCYVIFNHWILYRADNVKFKILKEKEIQNFQQTKNLTKNHFAKKEEENIGNIQDTQSDCDNRLSKTNLLKKIFV